MSAEGFGFLLMLAVVLLVGTSIYALWLWLNLWFTRQAFSRIAVIQATDNPRDTPKGGGCALLFLVLLVLATLFALLLMISG